MVLPVADRSRRRANGLDDSDRRLIERTQRGDQRAFAELVRRYQAVSFRVAYVITSSAEEAEDATQEGFIRAYRSIDRFRLDAPFRPWLLKIVANLARTRRGRAGRQFSVRLADVDVETMAADAQPRPETLAIANEQLDELMAALGELRQDDQRVIALRYFLDLSEVEMAGVLLCARGTVKSRLSRALVRLRHAMLAATEEAPHE